MSHITKALDAAYEAGWVEAACWAKRDDLVADVGSPAYLDNKVAHLDSISAALAQPEPVSLTDEQDRALCEANCNTHSDEYFKARPQLDSDVNRRIFYAGHRKAWITVAAAKGGAL